MGLAPFLPMCRDWHEDSPTVNYSACPEDFHAWLALNLFPKCTTECEMFSTEGFIDLGLSLFNYGTGICGH